MEILKLADVNVKMVMTMRENTKQKVEKMMEEKEEELQESKDSTASSRALNLAKVVQKAIVDELIALFPAQKGYKMRRGKSNTILFVGLQGPGKATSIAKFANYYQRRAWKTAMVCADTFRAGAFDQLKQNAKQLRVPFYGSYTEADPAKITEDGVKQFRKQKYEVIIVDTSGRHRQENALFEEMQEIAAADTS